MGRAAYDHFMTKCELFEVGVTLFAEAFVGEMVGQCQLTLRDQVRMTNISCCLP